MLSLLSKQVEITTLAPMPYGYYILARFVATLVFAYLSYGYFNAKREGLGMTFAALALLFQPFVRLALGRFLWNVIDVAAVAFLLFIVIKSRKSK